MWPYIAKVAEKVQTNKITCLAYGSYSRPYPDMPKLPPNVTVGYCGYSHPSSLLYKDKFEEYKKVVKQWADLANGQLAFWQHYLASNRSEENIGMPEHTPEIYAKVARIMARHGNHVFCEQMADSVMFELFNRYLLMKLFYNPALDEKAIFNDYVTRFYGPEAGPIIGEIYSDIGKKCVEKYSNNYAAYSFWEKLFDQSTMRTYREKTDLALKKAAGTEYEKTVLAFRKYYLGLMERGRLRYSDPLALLMEGFNPEFTCRQLKAPLKLDGKLDEPIWKACSAVAISNNVAGKPVLNLTTARTCYDSQHVYFAVSADAPDITGRTVESGDPGQADGIAIYLDVPHDRRGYCRLGIDLAGKVYAVRCDEAPGGSATAWESGAAAAVVTSASNYLVEVSIPRSALGAPDGDLSFYDWGVLVGRVQTEAAWTNERLSSTSRLLRGAFEQPLYFNTMRFTER